jgi:hypothetical protein
MYRIIVKGPAGESNIDDRIKLNGIDCQDEFSEYFHQEWNVGGKKDVNQQPLIDKGVTGGYMTFEYKDGTLYTVVEYESDKKLDEDEIEILKDYTQGQLSDGIGEGFEQSPCMEIKGKEIFLSPWFRGQKLKVEQIEVKGGKSKSKTHQMDSTDYWSEQYKDQIDKMNDLTTKLKGLLDKMEKEKGN